MLVKFKELLHGIPEDKQTPIKKAYRNLGLLGFAACITGIMFGLGEYILNIVSGCR